jgi:fatty acid desaturase
MQPVEATDAPPIEEDLSDRFHQLSRDLTDSRGISYRQFRGSLKPRYPVVWRDITLSYLALVAFGAALLAVPFRALPSYASVAGVLLGSACFGYFHQSLSLFIHEAAHLNLAASRKWNDFLSNLFLGVLQGFDIQAYRAKHFEHHRRLGQPDDPERHYFLPLDWLFFASTLSGARTALELVHLRKPPGEAAPSAQEATATRYRLNWVFLACACIHGGLVIGPALAGRWVFAISWTLGFLVWFPFFSMLRQILEHRDFRADACVDYSKVPHGALTRLFGDGPLASTLGAAGFNRHLLHHWEPQVSYTRFKELEKFLLDTPAARIVESRRTTYGAAFAALLAAGRLRPARLERDDVHR